MALACHMPWRLWPARHLSQHAVVARSTFGSEKRQSTPFSNHFWKLQCRENCALLWREAHVEVKSVKIVTGGALFEAEMLKKHTPLRSTLGSEHVQDTPRSEHFWMLRCRKGARSCGAKHVSKSKVLNTACSSLFGGVS